MHKLLGADGLRALACLMVIAHHLTQKLNLVRLPPELRKIGNFFITGSSGVSVFFVLSGFLLSMPFWKAYFAGDKMPDLRIYAMRRAGRIVPGFYFNLLFTFILGLILVPNAPALIWRYLAGLSFTSSFHWLTFFPSEINGPLWSIGFEVVSYALMPLGMYVLFRYFGDSRSFKKAISFWIKFILIAYLANEILLALVEIDRNGKGWQYGLVGGAKYWMPRYNPLGMFGHFLIGSMFASVALFWQTSKRAQALRWIFDLASIVVFYLWVSLLIGRGGQPEFSLNLQGQPYYYPSFAILSGLLLACLTQSLFMGKIFDNPFFQLTSKLSFGLYLYHYLVMFVIEKFVPDFRYAGLVDLQKWSFLASITLVVSYILAFVSWKFLEEPLLKKAQAWKPPFQWKSWMFALVAIFVLVPPALASVFVPTAWAFPKPYFVQKGMVLKIPEGRGTLTVELVGGRNTKGRITVALYRGGLWEDEFLIKEETLAASETAKVVFTDLAYGEYVVAGIHDEDEDGELDNDGTLPTEGLVYLGTPQMSDTFDTLKFIFDQKEMKVTYSVFYFE